MDLPENVSFEVAGTIPTTWLTAIRCLERGVYPYGSSAFTSQHTALVTNGTGAVGNAVLQICKALGAKAISLARNADRAKLV